MNNGDPMLTEEDISCLTDAANAIRKAARITDTPCAEMHTMAFLEVCMLVIMCDLEIFPFFLS